MESKKRTIAKLMVVAMSLSMGVSAQASETKLEKVPAFPGAEGGGKYVTGGRGQEVYIVTTLEDYIPKVNEPIKGSLRDAVSQGNRTVVFNVSGTIELKAPLRMEKLENITIAGQTAPGDGITVNGFETNISNSKNIIIRYMRFRPGEKNINYGDSMDAIWGRDMVGAMIDHVSASWSTDETMSLYRAKDMTVQWSMIAESLCMSGHTKGRHGYGGIWGGENAVYHHNLVATHISRPPRMGGGYDGKSDAEHIGTFQMSNNVIYNWGFNNIHGGGFNEANYINNYQKAGPGTRENVQAKMFEAGEKDKIGGFYVSGNVLEGNADITANNALGLVVPDVAAESTTIMDTPYQIEGNLPENLTVQTAQQAYTEVLAKAGATLPKRDAFDARVINEVKTGTGRFVNKGYEVGGLPVTTSEKRAVDFDSDCDGMADAWELKNGLNPKDAKDGKALGKDGKGYTNLENYMNSLANMNYAPESPEAKLVTPTYNAQYALGSKVEVVIEAKATAKNATIAKVELYKNAEKVSELVKANSEEHKTKTAQYKFDLKDLADGTYYISAKAIDTNGLAVQASASAIQVNSKFESNEWKSTNVGTAPAAGSASIDKNGVMTVKGAGKIGSKEGALNGDATQDSFQFVYQTLNGDGEIIAKVDSITAVDAHAFSGIMMRESLEANAAQALVGVSWVKAFEWSETDPATGKSGKYYRNPWSMYLAARQATGGDMDKLSEKLDSVEGALEAGFYLKNDIPMKRYDEATKKNTNEETGYYMKLVRQGDVFTAFTSPDGIEWTKIEGEKTVPMGETVYVGLAVDAGQVANKLVNVNTAQFSNVSVKSSTKTDIAAKEEQNNIEVAAKQDETPKAQGLEGFEAVVFGANINLDSNTIEISGNNVKMESKDGRGKIASNADGLAYFYKKLNASDNFEISATAKVESIAFADGQASFGIMARDAIAANGDKEALENACAMLGVGGINKATEAFVRKAQGEKYEHAKAFSQALQPAKTYELKLKKTADQYEFTINGETFEGSYAIFSDDMYVGLYTARNAKVEFSNIVIK